MKIKYKPLSGEYKALMKKEYDSWAISHYSPQGVFKFEFPMNEFPREGRTLHAMETKPVLTIDCEMKNNKFINLQVTEHMYEQGLGITRKDIYENMRTSSIMVFDYDLTKILPVPMWDKQNMLDYIENSDKEEYSGHIKSVLLAVEYIQYCNYPMTELYANWLISQPTFFKRKAVIGTSQEVTGSQEILDPTANQRIRTAISRIDSGLYQPNRIGARGGALTEKGERILYDFLKTYGFEKEDLESVLTLRYDA
jgi:hypothetical protein